MSILEILCAPIFRQNGQLCIFGPRFTQKWILGSEFQKPKSGFGINTSHIPCLLIFSQNEQLLIFWPKFGEIAQLRAIFWLKYCWGCCRELGGGCSELGGGWNDLGEGGWSWVELGGGGCGVWLYPFVFSSMTFLFPFFLKYKRIWYNFYLLWKIWQRKFDFLIFYCKTVPVTLLDTILCFFNTSKDQLEKKFKEKTKKSQNVCPV